MLNKRTKNTFIKYITGFWFLSIVAALMRMVNINVAPIIRGKIATPSPYIGIVNGRLKTTSGLERSFIQRKNDAPRNSIVVLNTINRAHNNGI